MNVNVDKVMISVVFIVIGILMVRWSSEQLLDVKGESLGDPTLDQIMGMQSMMREMMTNWKLSVMNILGFVFIVSGGGMFVKGWGEK